MFTQFLRRSTLAAWLLVMVLAPAAWAQAPSGTIAGTVTDAATGMPVADVWISFYTNDGGSIAWRITNAQGQYTSPALATGTYSVLASPPPSSGLMPLQHAAVSVVAPDTTTRDFALQPGGGITGTATNAATNAPVAAVDIDLFSSTGVHLLTVVTNALGQYVFPALQSGSYIVRARSHVGLPVLGQLYNNIPCPNGNCTITGGTPVVVAAPTTRAGIDFVLPPAGAISGTVTNTTAGPLAGIDVEVFSSNGTNIGRATTDALGRYTVLGLQTGPYYVRANSASSSGFVSQLYQNVPCPGGRCAVTGGTVVPVTEPSETSNINFVLGRGAVITGRVTNATTSAAIENVEVVFYTASGTSAGTIATDAQGRYTSPRLQAGQYYVRANPATSSGLISQVYQNLPCPDGRCQLTSGSPVTVTDSSAATNIDFALQQGGRITGTVTNAAAGAPQPYHEVDLFTSDGVRLGTVTTNQQGLYTSPLLAAGSYYARAKARSWSPALLGQLYRNLPCPAGTCAVTSGTPIVVTAGNTTAAIDFALSPVPAVANDLYANAQVVGTLPFQSVGNVAGATTGPEDPAVPCAGGAIMRSVWYQFTAPVTGRVVIDTLGSTFDTVLAVYTGAPGSFTSVGCSDNANTNVGQSSLVIQATAGQRLAVLVTSKMYNLGDYLVFSVTMPTFTATPVTLRFNSSRARGAITAPQDVTIWMTGATGAWTATSMQSWIRVTRGTGSGSGQFSVSVVDPGTASGVTLEGAVAVTAPAVSNEPITIPVTFRPSDYQGDRPIGVMATPVQNAVGVAGTIAVTGWALDDIGIADVKLYRRCLAFEPAANCVSVAGHNVVFVGNATRVTGARPDIEVQYSGYPEASRAAWGYLLLTNLLPHVPKQQMFGGQGQVTLEALATDMEGNGSWLVSSANFEATTITLANDTIARPFGAIDTPGQGATVSGTVANFGWALTPDADTAAGAGDIVIPTDGTTIRAFIDGVPAGLVTYNQCRGTILGPMTPAPAYCDDDVASIFGHPTPQATFTPRVGNPTLFRNLDAGRGAIGAYQLDTTGLSNGVHTIQWSVTDSAGFVDGIGSRFFTVLNAAGDAVNAGSPFDFAQGRKDPAYRKSTRTTPVVEVPAELLAAPAVSRGDAAALDGLAASSDPIWGRTGLDLNAVWVEMPADAAGARHVRMPDLGRVEVYLGAGVEAGYLVANGTLRDLPPGSHLDREAGVFTWAPGAGYLGAYWLTFVRGMDQIPVEVTVGPIPATAPGESEVRLAVDLPVSGATVSGALRIAGWALDPQAAIGSGIVAVHVWAQRTDVLGEAPTFLGAATLGGARADVAAVFGAQFATAAFDATTSEPLPSGQYDVTAYVRCARTGRWEDARTVTVIVR